MKFSVPAGLLGVSLLVILAPAQAQNRAEAWTLTPFAGGYLFDARQDLEAAPLFGLRGGYNISAHWGVELFGSYVLTESDRRSGPEINIESDVYRYGGTVLYHFQPSRRLVPFLAAGYSRYNITIPDLDRPETNESLLDLGGGLKYFVADDFALRADLRHALGFSPSIGNVEYTFGVSWQFGGVRPVRAALTTAPVVTAAAPVACPACVIPARVDSDGDSIEDMFDKCPGTPKGLLVDASGCVINQTIVLRAVNFLYDQDTLTEPSKATLDEVAAALKTQPGLTVEVAGHTDSTGSEAYNLGLSQRRASTVQAYLVSTGVDAALITASGYGEGMSISSNDSPEGRANNRRVEFRLRGATSGAGVYTEALSRQSKDAAVQPNQ